MNLLFAVIMTVAVLPCLVVDAQTAQSLSGFGCTADDVSVIGFGKVLNEPCNCPYGSSFQAQVQFTVTASTTRYCLTIYLCDPRFPNPIVLTPKNVDSTTTSYTATIDNYPCGSGLTCYGASGPGGQGAVFPKSYNCPVGSCCDTILWNTKPNDLCPDATPLKSQCRHHQICIQGKSATLDCVGYCNVATCSGTYNAALQMCVNGLTGPFTYSVTNFNTGTVVATATSSSNCTTLSVPVTGRNQVFVGSVVDSTLCSVPTRTNVTLSALPVLGVSLATFSIQSSCGSTSSGTFVATASGGNVGTNGSIKYQLYVDDIVYGSPQTTNTGSCTLTYSGSTDAVCHRVYVIATDVSSGCTAQSTTQRIKQCIQTSVC